MGAHARLGANSYVLPLDALVLETIVRMLEPDRWLVMYVCVCVYIYIYIYIHNINPLVTEQCVFWSLSCGVLCVPCSVFSGKVLVMGPNGQCCSSKWAVIVE